MKWANNKNDSMEKQTNFCHSTKRWTKPVFYVHFYPFIIIVIINRKHPTTFNIQWWRLFIIISHIYLLILWIELIVHRWMTRARRRTNRTCQRLKNEKAKSGWKFVFRLFEINWVYYAPDTFSLIFPLWFVPYAK